LVEGNDGVEEDIVEQLVTLLLEIENMTGAKTIFLSTGRKHFMLN